LLTLADPAPATALPGAAPGDLIDALVFRVTARGATMDGTVMSNRVPLVEAPMRHVSHRRTTLVVLTAVLVLIGSAVGADAVSHRFAYQKIRAGLPSGLPALRVTSTDLTAHRPIPQQFWGCTDAGVSPLLSWSGAPASTKSYAILMFDPDAPTGSGFWHWVAWDIPPDTTSLPTGAVLPPGSVDGENDGGTLGYTGPCPPPGDGVHHYEITVIALNVATLGLDATTHAAIVGFSAGHDAVAAGQLVATAQQ
jgi:Raf kinase inhibitor-like YbhB/YbcL family protein